MPDKQKMISHMAMYLLATAVLYVIVETLASLGLPETLITILRLARRAHHCLTAIVVLRSLLTMFVTATTYWEDHPEMDREG